MSKLVRAVMMSSVILLLTAATWPAPKMDQWNPVESWEAGCILHKAHVRRVVDGDTIDVSAYLDVDLFAYRRVRFLRVNTPERGKPGFREATQAIKDILKDKTVYMQVCGKDAFGRWLAEVYVSGIGNVSDWLLEKKLGVPYRKR